MEVFFDTDRISNGGFEHGSTRWTLTNSTIDTSFSFKGDRSVKTTSVVTSASSTTVVLQKIAQQLMLLQILKELTH